MIQIVMAREIMTMIVNCETQQNTKVILPRATIKETQKNFVYLYIFLPWDVMNVEGDYNELKS